MPTVSIQYDYTSVYYVDDDPALSPRILEVTSEEKVWIERTMKKFWAVQQFVEERMEGE